MGDLLRHFHAPLRDGGEGPSAAATLPSAAPSVPAPERWQALFNYGRSEERDDTPGQPEGFHDPLREYHAMTAAEREAYVAHMEAGDHSLRDTPYGRDPAPAAEEDGMLSRNAAWQERVRRNKETLRHDVAAAAAEDCTFAPRINAPPVPPDERATIAERSKRWVAEAQQRRADREARRAAEEKQRCSFRPSIVRSAWATAVTPRYLDTSDTAARPTPDGAAADECTFRPAINDTQSPGLQRYLRRPVHERLAARPQTPGRSQTPSREAKALSKGEQAAFTQRLAREAAAKQQRQQRLAEEAFRGECPGTPRLSQGTRALLKHKTQDECYAKIAESHARRRRELEAETKAARAVVRDVPQINARSRELAASSARARTPVVDRLLQAEARRRRKTEKLAAELGAEELRGATFRPAVHEAPDGPVASVLAPALGSSEGFSQLLLQQRIRRERLAAEYSADREASFAEECTFAPLVHAAPAFMSDIAQGRSVARGGSRCDAGDYLRPMVLSLESE